MHEVDRPVGLRRVVGRVTSLLATILLGFSPGPTPVLTTWLPNAVNYPPELIAEMMMMIDLPLVLAESIPQEFKCSAWAKRALNAGKYLWTGAVTAAGAVCCIGATVTAWVGCAVCAGAGGAVGAYVYDRLDNHCD